MMQALAGIGILAFAGIVIALSVKFLGPNNQVEQVAQEVIKEELPSVEQDIPEVVQAIEKIEQPAVANTAQAQ